MSQLNERARQLLTRYKSAESLADQDKSRLLALVEQRAARGDLPRFDVDASPPVDKPASTLAKVSLATAGKAALLVGVAAVGYLALHNRPLPPKASGLTPRETPSETAVQDTIAPTQATGSEDMPNPSSSAAGDPDNAPQSKLVGRATRDPRHVASTSSAQTTIDAEVAALSAAQTALKSGNAQLSLQLLNAYAFRSAGGPLADARSLTRIEALCQLGRTSLARQEGQRFLARYPNSLYADRVRGTCGAP